MTEVIWLRAYPRDPATAAPVEVLLAGGGQDAPYRHPVSGAQYRAGIVRRPLYSARLGFEASGWSGSTQPQTSAVDFSTADPVLRAELAGLVWDSAPVTIETRAERAAPALELAGKVKDASFTRAGLTLTIVDLSERLEQPVIAATFAGDGGIEGPAEAKGRPKRRSWGYVFNVEGRLIDAANSIYEFGDPAVPLPSWSALRDKGRAGSLTLLNWQGSIAATFAALQASVPAEGGGVAAPSIACAKWWTVPVGPLTADFIGSLGTGGAMQPAAIADAVSAAGGGPAVTDLGGANALRPGLAGLHIGDPRESFAQAIDRLLLGVSLLWLPRPDGTMAVLPWAFDEGAAVLRAEFKGRARTYPPHQARRLGFLKNERVHSDGEIAQVLVEGIPGVSPPLLTLNATQNVAKYDADDAYVGGPITFTAKPQNIPSGAALNFTIVRISDGAWIRSPTTAAALAAAEPGAFSTTSPEVLTISAGSVAGFYDAHGSFRVEISAEEQTVTDSVSIVKVKDGGNGLEGIPGLSNAPVTIYRRAAGAPALPSGETTWTFSTKQLADLDNGWGTAIPPDDNSGDPVWASGAIASSRTDTDAIGPNEWAEPEAVLQSGGAGAPGLNQATVTLFKRAPEGDPPAGPSTATIYTFGTGAVSGQDNGWTKEFPATNGEPAWAISAAAISAGATDEIPPEQWPVAAKVVKDGDNGLPGADGFGITLSPPTFVVPALASGAAKSSWTGGSCIIRLNKGGVEITAGVTYSYHSPSSIATPAIGGQTFTFADATADKGEVILRATYLGENYDQKLTVTRVKDGDAAFRASRDIGPSPGTYSASTTVPGNRPCTVSAIVSYTVATGQFYNQKGSKSQAGKAKGARRSRGPAPVCFRRARLRYSGRIPKPRW